MTSPHARRRPRSRFRWHVHSGLTRSGMHAAILHCEHSRTYTGYIQDTYRIRVLRPFCLRRIAPHRRCLSILAQIRLAQPLFRRLFIAMSSTQRPERVVHQDYIARIRYSNALPPPPNPPKLLDIPGTGLAGGQYTSAGYASRLAREQPLNIEADAELGMPIDLIGIPGVFDGDDRGGGSWAQGTTVHADGGTAISIRPTTKIHPADKELLKPLSAFGKASATGGAVSFLRRTEYTASQAPQHFANSTSKDLHRLRSDAKRRKTETVNRDDPINIIRHIVKGFDIAYPEDAYKGDDSTVNIRGAAITDAEAQAWARPKHPTKPDLHLLDAYPVLPDLDALPSDWSYLVFKFQNNPLSVDYYDPRLDSAILRPVEDPATEVAHQRRLAEWDPESSKPKPTPEYAYDYYVQSSDEAAVLRGLKRKFDVNDPENEDAALYQEGELNSEGQPCFKYRRIRTYETYKQHGNADNFYDDTVAVAFHDPELDVGMVPGPKSRLGKAAYYYPILQRTALRPKRIVNRQLVANQRAVAEAVEHVDELNLTVRDLAEQERAEVREKIAALDSGV